MNLDKNSCFTIGHSVNDIEYFINLLKKNKINCIVDVRSTPYSKIASQYNKEILKEILKKNKITYLHFGKEFGARRKDPFLLDENGIVDFESVRKSDIFKIGVERIKEGIKKKFKIALMCSEKEPFDCHRFALVSRGLEDNGINIHHILSDGSTISNNILEKKLIKKYNLTYDQLTLFGEYKSYKDAINEGYKLRNKDIGYIKEED